MASKNIFPKELDSLREFLIDQEWMIELMKHSQVYLVGGCVRDAYFRHKGVKDIDIIIEGLSIDKIRNILINHGKVDMVGETFSVLKFKDTKNDSDYYDISVPRKERKIGKGHKGFEVIDKNVTIYEDLNRRDFTMNAIAYCLNSNYVLDPHNGIKDIYSKTLRVVNKKAFKEDPLRILRGIQFASRFNLDIEKKTTKLMRKNSKSINEISPERIHDELMKIVNKNGDFIRLLIELNKTKVDKRFFGAKIPTHYLFYIYGIKYKKVDPVSFFFLLGMLTKNNPYQLYKEKLKGNNNLAKKIADLTKLYFMWYMHNDDTERKVLIFNLNTKHPDLDLDEIIMMPNESEKVISLMKKGLIPSRMKDLAVDGNDIMDHGIEGEKVGDMLQLMARDALNEKYIWKDKKDSLNYLEKIINEQ